VQLQVRKVGGFELRYEKDWPLPGTRWQRLYLDLENRGLVTRPNRKPFRVSYEAQGEGVTFMTQSFEKETSIIGPVAARIFASSNTPDMDLFLTLQLFDSRDEELVFQGAIDPHTPVAQGWLRASHRKLDRELSTVYRPYHTHDEKEPLTPGEVYQLDIEIWPTCIVVPAGYRLGLNIRGSDYVYKGGSSRHRLSNFKNDLTGCGPFLHNDTRDRPLEVFGGTNSLHTKGDSVGYLLVPVVP
jgi:predicted acyl esterase